MNEILALHKNEYAVSPEVVAVAPGSVNLMGSHTDYNSGYVIKSTIDRWVTIGVSKRKDNSLRFYAADLDERKRTTITNLKYKREDRWANYPKGALFELYKLGYVFKGIDITITGNIPQKIGLSSSAAIEVAVLLAVKKLYSLDINDMQLIKCAAVAESSFMGTGSEITDQLVSFVSKRGNVIFLDSRTQEYSYIPFKFDEIKFLVTNSNVPHGDIANELSERRNECKECVSLLNKKKKGTALRDYSVYDLQHSMGIVPENLRRICKHVVEENQRTLEAKEALLVSDLVTYGKLLNRSHESLRDQYEVSCPEIDWLVKRSWELDCVLGSRLTGSGFGGCTITLIKKDEMEQYIEKLEEYERIFGFECDYFFCEPTERARVIYPE